MANKTTIQWCDLTWNVARGCTKVDEDCKFCYMYRDSFDGTRYNPREIVRTKSVFNLPLTYKKTKSEVWDGPPLVFVSSLTDWAHEAIDSYRVEMWDIIRKCPHLTFLMLTKRPERLPLVLPEDWGEGWQNVWLGTSAGSNAAKAAERIYNLSITTAKTRFVSLEPLHSEMDLQRLMFDKLYYGTVEFNVLKGIGEKTGKDADRVKFPVFPIDWVIVGGESGNDTGKYRYRECKKEWLVKIVSDCKQFGVPVFVKQMGTFLAKQYGMNDRHGGDINEFPEVLKYREFPNILK